ncbi:toll/interleukin-1 receptor domain-containing protein [Solirubrobacter taibaiensis]|nr:toll/interleukin-1 receptor domain-containing protein [Solirubrobacter taibaiensis]
MAVADQELEASEHGRGLLARLLAELHDDKWVAFDYDRWPGDDVVPKAYAFTTQHLQRARRIRLTPDGWRAIGGLPASPAVAAGRSSVTASSVPSPALDLDVFISHAREDKDTVARPLAQELERRGWRVWFDESELTVGDGLRRTIDDGLSRSRFGVVVLSPAFFSKDWPQRELDGLVAREVEGRKVVLPVWHGVDAAYVTRYSPTLADKMAASSAVGVVALAEDIERALVKGETPRDPGDSAASTFTPQPQTSAANPVMSAIMAQNPAALREVLRAEMAAYGTSLQTLVSGRHREHPNAEVTRPLMAQLMPATERLATMLLPLVEHDPVLFDRELRSIAGRLMRGDHDGYAFWSDLPRASVWWLTHVLGAYALRREAFGAIRSLLATQVVSRGNRVTSIAGNFSSDALSAVAAALGPEAPKGQQWKAPEWRFLVTSVSDSAALRSAWPELFEFDNDPRRALAEWSFIQCLGLGLQGQGTVAWWALGPQAIDLAARLHRDRALRQRLAVEAFDITLDDLDTRANEALGHSGRIQGSLDDDAARMYLTGTY